jgi:hypothetical protein
MMMGGRAEDIDILRASPYTFRLSRGGQSVESTIDAGEDERRPALMEDAIEFLRADGTIEAAEGGSDGVEGSGGARFSSRHTAW